MIAKYHGKIECNAKQFTYDIDEWFETAVYFQGLNRCIPFRDKWKGYAAREEGPGRV